MDLSGIREVFRSRFGEDPEWIGIAPGRINLIGEHTDYNDGFVFPAAIDRGLLIAASLTSGETETYSSQLGEGKSFDSQNIAQGFTESWAKYPAGMAWALSNHKGKPLPNLKAVVDSTIPIGSGVSSSAALEMAFGVVWNEVANLGIENRDLARLGQICENKFVGVNSGIMDQMASAMGREGHAMFLDTRSLMIEYAPVPIALTAVLCDTKKERALTSSAYNERRSQCETAAAAMGVKALRDADSDRLEACKSALPEIVYRRAKHVITENERCVAFKGALASSNYAEIGKLMYGSHQSLRFDYEVSCDELDWMAESAWQAPGCVGARMTGAGFGGACVALVDTNKLLEFIDSTLEGFQTASGVSGEAMSCRIVDGARLLEA